MQPTHYDSSGYQTGLYGTSPTYDGSTIKLHHGHFPDPGSETCYNGYLNCSSSPGNYIPRDPPSYAESTLFHSGFMPNSSTSYYKLSGRQLDSDYGMVRNNDQLMSKNEMLETSPHTLELSHRFDTDTSRLLSNENNTNGDVQNIKLENTDYKTELQSVQTNLSPDSSLESPQDESKDDEKDDKSMEVPDLASPDKGHDEKARGNADVKPALSYIALIAKSILESPQKRLSLGSIYSWIEKNYPYYLNRGQGWRNSVRHNLSLNDCFIKAGRCEDGKGNYWAIHPANIQDFMRGDFRQRRRSRRRGRKKDCELGMYHMPNGYSPLTPSVPFSPAAAFSSIYSPYTEAERRAYRLDEALLRQSMNNPFMKWYHNGVPNASYSTQNTGCNTGMYSNTSTQWQGYNDQSSQSVYQLNSSLSR